MTNIDIMKLGKSNKNDRAPTPVAAPHLSAVTSSPSPDLYRDGMIDQLREIITGPQTRLNESRYSEFINILTEQRADIEARFDRLQAHLDTRIEETRAHLEIQMMQLRQAQNDSLNQFRSEHQLRLQTVEATFNSQMQDIENSVGASMKEFSGAMSRQTAELNVARERDRDHVMNVLGDRIEMAKRDHSEQQLKDFEDIAATMADVGRKLQDMRKR